MKSKIEQLLLFLLVPLAVGQFSALFSGGISSTYAMLPKPALSPPAIVFPIVWTILYLLMGFSAYLIATSGDPGAPSALTWYSIQLFLNFLWSPIFFGLGKVVLAFVLLLLLILVLLVVIYKFYKIRPLAAYLLLPYLLWCFFAAYLTCSIASMNA